MTARPYALVAALGLSIATGAFAAANYAGTNAGSNAATDGQTISAGAPGRWIPDWLREPLSRAIADATDPRDRKAR